MIEFTIPLNLPVRAVAITDATVPPPFWLIGEMERWADKQHPDRANAQSSPQPQDPTTPQNQSPPQTLAPIASVERDEELRLLRSQRNLFQEAVRELRHATKLVEQRLDGMVHELQMATVELAHAISAKLIFDEIDENRFPIANLVHEVIGRLDISANATVRLHPDDLAVIQELPTIGTSDGEHAVNFIGDPSLHRGNCKAKAGEISVVYDMRRQIDEIRRQLLSTVNGHAEA